MSRKQRLFLFHLPIIAISITGALGSISLAGITKGSDIYCTMRQGGNKHESSWKAAYQSIKNKKQGLFKTSPKQAASLIVEEVVSEPDKYQDCIPFLGDLYPLEEENAIPNNQKQLKSKNKGTPSLRNTSERYSY